MTTTDPAAHADDDVVERHPHGPDCGCDACAERWDDALVDDDGPDPEDDEPDPDERVALIVARAVVGFAVTALVLLAVTFVLTLAAVWTSGETSDDLASSAAACFVAAAMCTGLVITAPRVLR